MDHVLHWQKSTFSDGGDGNTCVEIAATSTATLRLRESDSPTTELTINATPLAHLIHAVKSARFRT